MAFPVTSSMPKLTCAADEVYDRLSETAPTIPYDDKPWQTSSWQAVTTSIGQALGRPARAAQHLEEGIPWSVAELVLRLTDVIGGNP